MKICTKTHVNPTFGEIPEGSLWEDDSPYIAKPKFFAPVPEAEEHD